MLTYTMNGKMVHITGDKQTTICGKNCSGWDTQRDNIDWNGFKRDCPTCGNKSDFDYERSKIAHQLEERAKADAAAEIERKARAQKAQEALATLSAKWQEFLAGQCPELKVKNYYGATIFKSTVIEDGFKFGVELKLELPY